MVPKYVRGRLFPGALLVAATIVPWTANPTQIKQGKYHSAAYQPGQPSQSQSSLLVAHIFFNNPREKIVQ